MFTLALADSDVYTEIVRAADTVDTGNLADILFWRAFSLEGLLRPREALDSYMAALDADPCHSRAKEQFHVLFESISRNVEHVPSSNDPTMSPSSSTRRATHRQSSAVRPRERRRSEAIANESVATDSHTSGTTASRRSSRSTTPTDSSGSEQDD